jgi:hypothetical protein
MFFTLFTLLALGAGSLAIQFDGPSPTHAANPLSVNLNGWTPSPTQRPHSPPLFRRQDDEAICGFLDGDRGTPSPLPFICTHFLTSLADYPVSCTVGTCGYYPSNNWFGCCTGTVVDDCAMFTTCIASASMSSCASDPACASDAFGLACIAASAPNCMTMLSSVSGGTVSHFVCGQSASVTFEVLPTPTGTGAGSLGSPSATQLSGALSATGTSRRLTASSRRLTSSASDEETSTEEPTAKETADEPADEPSTSRPGRTTSRNSGSSAATQASSTAGAMRTAQAVAAAAGGMAGVLAWLV